MNDEQNENEQDMEKPPVTDDNKFIIFVFLVGILMVISGVDMPSAKPSSEDGWFFHYLIQPFVYKWLGFFWILWNRYLGIILVFFSLDRMFLKGWILGYVQTILNKFLKPELEKTE